MLTRGLAKELAPYKIRVNAICPGLIDTPAWEFHGRKWAEWAGEPFDWEETKKKMGKRVPLGYVGRIEDVGNLAFFLVSNQANYISGQALNLTGGMTTI